MTPGATRACGRLQDRLAAAADDREPADLALFRHVRGCPDCRARLDRYRQMRGALAGLEPSGSTSDAVVSRSSSRLLRPALAAPAGAGIAALLTAVAAALVRRHLLRAS